MNKPTRSRSEKPGAPRIGRGKPRAQRATDDTQRTFFERKGRRDASQSAGEAPFQRGGSNREARERRPERQDNVSFFLSERMLELAEELASEAGLPLKAYLSEALKYILLAHGKRLGKSDKYITEFTSQNKTPVATWRPQSGEEESLPTEGLPVESLPEAPEIRTERRYERESIQSQSATELTKDRVYPGRPSYGDRKEPASRPSGGQWPRKRTQESAPRERQSGDGAGQFRSQYRQNSSDGARPASRPSGGQWPCKRTQESAPRERQSGDGAGRTSLAIPAKLQRRSKTGVQTLRRTMAA